MKIKMKYRKDTKSCYVFSAGEPRTEDHKLWMERDAK